MILSTDDPRHGRAPNAGPDLVHLDGQPDTDLRLRRELAVSPPPPPPPCAPPPPPPAPLVGLQPPGDDFRDGDARAAGAPPPGRAPPRRARDARERAGPERVGSFRREVQAEADQARRNAG